MIGVCGLFFFMVGYALVRNDLIGGVFSLCIDENEVRLSKPGSCTMVGGLAEQEAQLFEGLGEGILARHGGNGEQSAKVVPRNRRFHRILVPEIRFILPADRRLRLLAFADRFHQLHRLLQPEVVTICLLTCLHELVCASSRAQDSLTLCLESRSEDDIRLQMQPPLLQKESFIVCGTVQWE